MSPLALSIIIFLLTLAGIGLGTVLRAQLPKHHLDKDSQDVVKLGLGLVATIGALVLGLLIASAKTSFDTQSNQVRQITADAIQLDNLLAEFGPETLPLRQGMRATMGAFADKLWREHEQKSNAPFATNAAAEQVYVGVRALAAHTDTQRSLQARAVQVADDMAQTRMLLFVESGSVIPAPFLAVLVSWLVIIFASFTLFARMNPTVFVALCLFALSASAAIFLILELSQPFGGLMQISGVPLRSALAPLSP
jgi:hypothetical protein